MAEQWDDLYLRHSFADTGQYPTAGTQSASPDIIPLGSNPISDPQDLITGDNWTKDYGNSTNASQANYIYLRGANLGDTQTEGQLYLYYSPGSLLLWPTDPLNPKKGWSTRPLQTSLGEKFQTVRPGAGQRFVTPEGFLWIPEPISNDHYCLVGRVVTAKHPNPIPAIGDLTDFALYISQHPDMAWRNVVTINPSNPVTTTQVDYSQGSVGGEVYLILRCDSAPNGSRVQFTCGTPGPVPMINMSGVVQNTDSTEGPRYSLTLLTNIPANWTSNIAYTWFSEGKTPLPGMKIWLDAVMPVAEDNEKLIHFAKPLTELGVAEEAIPQVGPRKGIVLGSSGMQTIPVALNGPSLREYGVSRASGAAAAATSVLFSGVTWGTRYSSVFGTSSSNVDVAVTRDVVSQVEVETVTLSDSSTVPAAEETPDVSVDTVLSTGAYTGPAMASLIAVNVPVGCDIWFRNLDGSVTIAVAPTPVSNAQKFTVVSMIDNLPADYVTTIRSALKLNGNTLPGAAELKFSVYEVLEGELDEDGAPKPGKLLGAVTLKP